MTGEDLRFNPFVSSAGDYIPEVKSTVTPPHVDKYRYRVYMASQHNASEFGLDELIEARKSSNGK